MGSHNSVYKKLIALRHKRLAHRQLVTATAFEASATDMEIEEFYQDNSKLIQILLSVVNALAYDPDDTAKVFQLYASQFWSRLREQERPHLHTGTK